MNTIHKQQFLVILIFLGLVLMGTGQGATPALAKSKLVPLKGTFSGVGANFSGHLTHFGRFQGVIDNTANPPTALWTAANGDTITNQTASFNIDLSAPIAPNVYPYTQILIITSGKGRFSNATGQATITGTINVSTFEYDGRLEGTISLPNQGS